MVSSAQPDRAGRLRSLQSALVASDLDALVVSGLPNITYLSGFGGSAALLLLTRAECTLISDGRYTLAITEGTANGSIVPMGFERVTVRYDLTLTALLDRLALQRVGFEATHVSVATLQAWQRAVPSVQWIDTHNLVERQRAIKDPWEQAVYRRGGPMMARVAGRLPEWVRAGRSERDIAAAIELGLIEEGFSKPAFPTIVASGPNSAFPHLRPTERRLAVGDLVVLDFGGVLDGYCLDLTRMCAVGPVSTEAHGLFRAVHEAHRAAVEAVRPGVEAAAIDRAARSTLELHGLGEAFSHGTGHGLGLEVHESPRIARGGPDAPEVVEAGMVFTIEPGAYVPHLGGVRLEDDVLVTASGCEVLTDSPRELLVV